MKKKFAIALLITTCLCYSQKHNDIFQVVIFKSKESDMKNRKFIKIDSLGNILSFNKPISEKLNIKELGKSAEKFIKKTTNVEKIPASDIERPLTVIPKKGEYTLEITIKFLQDYHSEKNRKSVTKYYWVNVSENDEQDLFLKYLSKENKEVLTRLLN